LPLFGPGGHRGGPGFGHGPGGFGPGHAAVLDAAATYLGMTEAQLRTALEGGKTLAQVARDRGKTVQGLVDALVGAAKKDLAKAVEDGRLTEAQKDAIVSGLPERITAAVNGELRSGRGGDGFRGPHLGPPGGWHDDPGMPDEDDGATTPSDGSGTGAARLVA
jgi:hypothetical protein